MKKLLFLLCLIPVLGFAQEKEDTTTSYKKRVLEKTEVSIISSYYEQDGDNAAVTGGIGSEYLDDIAGKIVVSIPLNDDDVLSIDAKVSAYTSASSGNVNPFNTSASEYVAVEGSPWVASSGASESDVLETVSIAYSHSSDDRNRTWSANMNVSHEYDYNSIGLGGAVTHLFNKKNTGLTLKGNVQIGKWEPMIPVEIEDYVDSDGDLNSGIFEDADILNEMGYTIWKEGEDVWTAHSMELIDNSIRNTYSASLNFSQILSSRMQFSLIADVIYQNGWLGNPMQRVYFQDKENYFMGESDYIPVYNSPDNIGVFQLADDIERLPSQRLKLPVATRFNVFLNEYMVIKTYYRFYYDNWGIMAHTANVEVPIKIPVKVINRFTLYPSYRYYTQTAADYFAPFDMHLSTSDYYTSDYDLSEFASHQLGFGLKYTNICYLIKTSQFGLKDISLDYAYYWRNTGLKANIISLKLGFEFK